LNGHFGPSDVPRPFEKTPKKQNASPFVGRIAWDFFGDGTPNKKQQKGGKNCLTKEQLVGVALTKVSVLRSFPTLNRVQPLLIPNL